MMQLEDESTLPTLPFLLPEYRHLPPIHHIVTSSNLFKKKSNLNLQEVHYVCPLTWFLRNTGRIYNEEPDAREDTVGD